MVHVTQTQNASRHGRPSRYGRLEPAQWLLSWLLSAARRGWRWVWSADHDDVASTAVAWFVQFCMTATLILSMVAATR